MCYFFWYYLIVLNVSRSPIYIEIFFFTFKEPSQGSRADERSEVGLHSDGCCDNWTDGSCKPICSCARSEFAFQKRQGGAINWPSPFSCHPSTGSANLLLCNAGLEQTRVSANKDAAKKCVSQLFEGPFLLWGVISCWTDSWIYHMGHQLHHSKS